MLMNLLFFRFLLLNSLVTLGLFIAYQQGWLQSFIQNDRSYISSAILIIFAGAWLYQGVRAFIASKRINRFKILASTDALDGSEYSDFRYKSVAKLMVLRDKDLTKISWMQHIVYLLVFLGFIGTVLGFLIALSAVPEASLSGQEGIEGLQNSVGVIISGMKTAIYTTLAGGIFGGLVIYINAVMIHTAVFNSWCDIIDKCGQ